MATIKNRINRFTFVTYYNRKFETSSFIAFLMQISTENARLSNLTENKSARELWVLLFLW